MPQISPGDTFYDKLPDGRYEKCILQPTTDETPDRMNAARGGTGEFYRRVPIEELGSEDKEDEVVIFDSNEGMFVILEPEV
jgi:hypothetical protein